MSMCYDVCTPTLYMFMQRLFVTFAEIVVLIRVYDCFTGQGAKSNRFVFSVIYCSVFNRNILLALLV